MRAIQKNTVHGRMVRDAAGFFDATALRSLEQCQPGNGSKNDDGCGSGLDDIVRLLCERPWAEGENAKPAGRCCHRSMKRAKSVSMEVVWSSDAPDIVTP